MQRFSNRVYPSQYLPLCRSLINLLFFKRKIKWTGISFRVFFSCIGSDQSLTRNFVLGWFRLCDLNDMHLTSIAKCRFLFQIYDRLSFYNSNRNWYRLFIFIARPISFATTNSRCAHTFHAQCNNSPRVNAHHKFQLYHTICSSCSPNWSQMCQLNMKNGLKLESSWVISETTFTGKFVLSLQMAKLMSLVLLKFFHIFFSPNTSRANICLGCKNSHHFDY